MEVWQMIVTIIGSIMGSGGLWSLLQSRHEKNDVKTKMLVGLAHDRIIYLGMSYIERGCITKDEYENLHDYLYVPYSEMGGNGSAKRIMSEVNKIPIYTEKRSDS